MAASVKVGPGIDWVGVFDPGLRVFDIIMRTNFGTTYNAYLVRGRNKTVLIDLVKSPFAREFWKSLEKLTPLDRIDYIITNHTEPDHTGALASFLAEGYRPTVIGSKSGLNFLEQMVNRPFKSERADQLKKLDLGGRTLEFISAPFLHWPDSIITYLPEDKLIFSCDFLGSHFCDCRMFDDLADDFSGPREYYFQHIMRPFKKHVLAALDKVEPLDLEIICPSHGPILRTDIRQYLDDYRKWSAPPSHPGKKVIVVYVSAYGNTRLMAETIAKGFTDSRVEVKLYDVTQVDIGQLRDEIEVSDALLLGSPTINGDALEPIWNLLAGLATISLKGKLASAFGSYGWSGEAVDMLMDRLKGIKMKTLEKGLKIQFVPDETDLSKCTELSRTIEKKLLGVC